MLKNKRAEPSVELKNIKNHKFGNIFNKKILEDLISDVIRLEDKNKDKFEKEVNNLRNKITELIQLQENNKKIAEANLDIFKENLKIEESNIEVSVKNKEYLTDLFERVNNLK